MRMCTGHQSVTLHHVYPYCHKSLVITGNSQSHFTPIMILEMLHVYKGIAWKSCVPVLGHIHTVIIQILSFILLIQSVVLLIQNRFTLV